MLYKVMMKEFLPFLAARDFTNSVANLRQSKPILYRIIFINKLYLSYFLCRFCWNLTADCCEHNYPSVLLLAVAIPDL